MPALRAFAAGALTGLAFIVRATAAPMLLGAPLAEAIHTAVDLGLIVAAVLMAGLTAGSA